MSYSRRKIQEVAYRLYSRYHHLFIDDVEGNWAAISVLDDIPLEWVKIWEEDSENLGPGGGVVGRYSRGEPNLTPGVCE